MRDKGVVHSVISHMPKDRNPQEPSETYLKLRLKHKDATGLQKKRNLKLLMWPIEFQIL
jgi:hypothetical protein